MRETMETAIRDMAGTVIAYVQCRNAHPSYGYTKTMIRDAAARLEGAIGLYMIATGQAANARVTTVAVFDNSATAERINTARDLVKGL